MTPFQRWYFGQFAKDTSHLGEHAIILSDRRVPKTRGNIDHLVISPSGVWVVDAKNYSGLVEQRDVGGWFKTDLRLYVGGRDRSKVLDGLAWQVAAVHSALEGHNVPVSPAVCVTDAEWRLFSKPFILRGVHVSGPNALARRIAENPKLASDEVLEIAVDSHSPYRQKLDIRPYDKHLPTFVPFRRRDNFTDRRKRAQLTTT